MHTHCNEHTNYKFQQALKREAMGKLALNRLAGFVTQRVKLQFETRASCTATGPRPAAPLPTQLLLLYLGKAVKDSPTVWAPVTPVEERAEAPSFGPGCCVHLGSEPVRCKTFLDLSLFFCISLPYSLK